MLQRAGRGREPPDPHHSSVTRACLLLLLSLGSGVAHGALQPGVITGVRLAGDTPGAGLVEVEFNGTWLGALCFDIRDDMYPAVPDVVCRQLGFEGGGVHDGWSNYEGAPRSYLGTLGVPCPEGGAETALAQCGPVQAYQGPPGLCTVEPGEETDFGFLTVVCRGTVQVEEWRLVGGSVAGEGRLEARIDGSWATVCPGQTHEQALQAVADVACRSLGMPGPALYRGASLFGNASLDQVLRVQWCTGDEARLEDCAAALAGDAALCGAPAFGVACNGSEALVDVHLAGGRTEREGSIEVQLAPGGRWSSLSGEDAGAAARLACVELGFGGGVARVGPLFTESGGAAPAAIASLRCGANATTLNECSFAGVLEASYWPGPGPLGAACDGAQTVTGVRLADGASPREGRLELQLLGRSEWLAVMGVGAVPSTIAEVACRQLNFTGGQLIDFPGGPTPISDLSCSGQEASLDECGLRYEPEGGSPVSLGVRCS